MVSGSPTTNHRRGWFRFKQQVNREVAQFVSSHDYMWQDFQVRRSCYVKNFWGNVGYVGEVNKSWLTRSWKRKMVKCLFFVYCIWSNGVCYNGNADNVASKVAIGCPELVYLSDVRAAQNTSDPNSLLSSLAVNEVEPSKNSGVISSGMLPKVNSAVEARKRR